MLQHVNIICLNVPYPVDMGINFESFYKIKALHQIGVSIHLHCFIYGSQVEQPTLLQYCTSVTYYQRTKAISVALPYIVSSRHSKALEANLLLNNYPIIMDGIHTSAIVGNPQFANRKLIVRALNVEYLYYRGLAKAATFGLHKLYYAIESIRPGGLQQYEKRIAKQCTISTLSPYDYKHFTQILKATAVTNIPIFYESEFTCKVGLGSYCLYQGNLSVAENEAAVIWLLQNVFDYVSSPLIIAGKNPSKHLTETVKRYKNCTLIANPTNVEMLTLITDAQINVLPSINATGVKLKLLQALYNGRHCITNANGAASFEQPNLFTIATKGSDCITDIIMLMQQPFTQQHINDRLTLLQQTYNSVTNAHQLIKCLQ